MSASGFGGSTTQAITPSKWYLTGLVSPQDIASKTAHSVIMLRPKDALSLQIKSAVTAQSVVPAVQITTSKGLITLTNAKVASVGPPQRTHKPVLNTHEIEEIKFTFQKITATWVEGSTSSSDDWLSNP